MASLLPLTIATAGQIAAVLTVVGPIGASKHLRKRRTGAILTPLVICALLRLAAVTHGTATIPEAGTPIIDLFLLSAASALSYWVATWGFCSASQSPLRTSLLIHWTGMSLLPVGWAINAPSIPAGAFAATSLVALGTTALGSREASRSTTHAASVRWAAAGALALIALL